MKRRKQQQQAIVAMVRSRPLPIHAPPILLDDPAIDFKKKNFTTKLTKATKKGRKIQLFQTLTSLHFFVRFVSSWFYFS